MSKTSTPAKTPTPSWAEQHKELSPFLDPDLAAPRPQEPEIYWRARFMQELEEARKYEPDPFLFSSRYNFDPLSDISSKEIEDPLYSIKLYLDIICHKQSYLEAIASTIEAYPNGEALELLAPFYLSEMEEALEPLSYSFANNLAQSIIEQGGIPTEEIRRALNDTIWNYDESLFSIVNALLGSKCLEGLYLPIGRLRLAFHTASDEILHQLQRFCILCEGDKRNCFTTSNARAGAILDTIKQTLLELSLTPTDIVKTPEQLQIDDLVTLAREEIRKSKKDPSFKPTTLTNLARSYLAEPKQKDRGYNKSSKAKDIGATLANAAGKCLTFEEQKILGLNKQRAPRKNTKPSASLKRNRKSKPKNKRL